jgi:cob(I)alamin adenosyltransferase
MRIYTGGGDRGKTSLFSGERVPKDHGRIEAYGDVDELNSLIGALLAALTDTQQAARDELRCIQVDLFHLSAWLATTPGSPAEDSLEEFNAEKITSIENAIDRLESKLPALKHFILPGGHIAAAWAHVARAVCRRAERHVLRVLEEAIKGGADENSYYLLMYLNRLSDYLFMLARYLNKSTQISENIWKK